MKHSYIYSNYDLSNMYEDAKESLKENYYEEYGTEYEELFEPSDDAIWDEIYRWDEDNWDCEKYELDKFFKDKMCIFAGSIGRWDGTYRGGKIGKFWDLFNSALSDCAYYELYDEDGHLFIHGSHHDGDVFFEVKVLTDKGYEFSENWEYGYGNKKYDYPESEMHERIMKCSFLSRLPKYWESVYGIKR